MAAGFPQSKQEREVPKMEDECPLVCSLHCHVSSFRSESPGPAHTQEEEITQDMNTM